MDILLFGIIGFSLGSIPFSFLIVKLTKGSDIREFGDGNPGAINAFKAGGWKAGVMGLALDFLKGFLPTFFAARNIASLNYWMIPVALAPVLGHAYSPMLNFRGGKAITTTFGIWAGLTLYQAPLLLGAFCTIFLVLLKSPAWAILLAFFCFAFIFPLISWDPILVWISVINFFILLHKHFPELHVRIPIRKKLKKIVRVLD